MPTTYVRAATRADALYLADRLRPEDVAELRASGGLSPLEALLQGLEESTPHAWVLCDARDRPCLMGGVRDVGDRLGIVWLLTAHDVEQHALAFQREARRMLRRLFREGGYRAVANAVSADNHRAIRWLKRLGFRFIHLNVPVGRNQEPFHSFAIGAAGYV